MVACDLALVCTRERTAANDVVPTHDEPVDPMGTGEDERRHAIICPAELEPLGRPDREVGLLPRCDLTDVVSSEDLGATACPQPQRLRLLTKAVQR